MPNVYMAKPGTQSPVAVAVKAEPVKRSSASDSPLSAQNVRESYANGLKNAKAYRLKQLALLHPEVADLIKSKRT